MGVYIKGMEMPKSCSDCACYHHRFDDGYYDFEICGASGTVFNDGYSSVTGHKTHIDPFKARLDNCPLVPVPAHGRLIDADALKDKLELWLEWENALYVEHVIDHAPTIIPADPAEEGN